MRTRLLAINLVNVFLSVVEVALGLRFILKLFGANPNNDFVSWLYSMTSVLLDPFRGIFPTKVFENKYIFEFVTLFAMLIYAMLALLIIAVINAVTEPATPTKKTTIIKKRA